MPTALISVTDKTGIIEFARVLKKRKFKILSTGGTAQTLRNVGIDVEDVSRYTGFPEIMGGRIKTLHPKIFGGILARRTDKEDEKIMREHSMADISIVVVNLYQFKEAAAREGISEEEVIERIDIGGPSLIRAAAKNFSDVTVIVDPGQYAAVAAELEKNGETSLALRKELAWAAFEKTAQYDLSVRKWFRTHLSKPDLLELHYEKVRTLRYGENPHQPAAFFRNPENHDSNVTNARVLHGKELSFNNIVDANCALELVKEFQAPTVAFIKHNNPCGVASSRNIEDAFEHAFLVDSKSAFGSVIALNRPITEKIAEYIKDQKIFVELIICPSFEKQALKILTQRPNIRLLEVGDLVLDSEKRDIKKVAGGILVQTANTLLVTEKDLKVVTKKAPTKEQIRALLFANVICKHVMSNAVVFAKSHGQRDWVTGIGAGQQSRVDAVWIGAHKGAAAVKGSVMASDAFFPFQDGVEEAAKAGAEAIIAPGGSVRDAEVIACADRLGLAMVFTGVRMFRH